MKTDSCDIGIIGLGTMGRSLALNFLDHGQRVVAWNLEPELTASFAAAHARAGLHCADTLVQFVAALRRPRRLLLMIKAGSPVDDVIAELTPSLEPGDIVIDGGNAHFEHTRRRHRALAALGIEFVGMGVSGGEAGARFGPSLMVGGSERAWAALREPFGAIAATSPWGSCAARMGGDGAGHFVKMIHNGIEYADMQLTAEVYDLFRRGLGVDVVVIEAAFRAWQQGPLQSFLIGLTADVLSKRDAAGQPLVEQILDAAEQKGTGRWTIRAALELGVAAPTIAAAVDARVLSSAKQSRLRAARILAPSRLPEAELGGDPVEALQGALLAAKICAYAQGMQIIRAGSAAYGWHIPLREVARVWTGGCIIRARLLDDMIGAFGDDPSLDNLVFNATFAAMLRETVPRLRRAVAYGIASGVPVPALGASLAWFDSIRSATLPQNLTQAQRDAFGAHTYRRLDDPNTPVHTEWQP